MASLIKYFSSYIVDYIVLVSMQSYIIFIATKAQPFLSQFDPFDPKINHDFKPNDTVSDINCISIALLIPIIIITLRYIQETLKNKSITKNSNTTSIIGFLKNSIKLETLHKFHISFLGLLYSITISTFIVCVLKNWIGRPRPDFIGRCKPSFSAITLPQPGSTIPVGKILYDISICTGDHDIILEGLRSHPSGHSALSFSGMNYLTIWLISQIHYFPNNSSTNLSINNTTNSNNSLISTLQDSKIENIRSKQIWKFILLLIPTFIALWVAISRLQDYRHHPTDIISGSIIGILVSLLVHWKFFKNGKPIYLNEISEGLPLPLPLYND